MQNVESSAGFWGGARKGAGRKRMEKGKYYGFNSTPDVEAILEAVEGSKAAAEAVTRRCGGEVETWKRESCDFAWRVSRACTGVRPKYIGTLILSLYRNLVSIL